ncbi:MAG: HEAT repeat domain-containing protein [Anaerolineae bacterium]|nr:MAG: HEAT repeat domain-containing protein [Anaerolineae bacterium]
MTLRGLDEMEREGDVEALIEVLDDVEGDELDTALEALARLGDVRAYPVFEGMLADDDIDVRANAARALLVMDVGSPLARRMDRSLWLAIAVNQLVFAYRDNPLGFVAGDDTWAGKRVRAVGSALNAEGGMALMQRAHREFSELNEMPGAARNLEIMWGGIGEWMG